MVIGHQRVLIKGVVASGRTSATVSLTSGQTVAVTVGAGGVGGSGNGGTSSFGAHVSCGGGTVGRGEYYENGGLGISGGGRGLCYDHYEYGTSNCPAVLTLTAGATDASGGLYTAKSYTGGGQYGGGAGCYAAGAATSSNGTANSGAGGGASVNKYGGSGKVIVFYYKYV